MKSRLIAFAVLLAVAQSCGDAIILVSTSFGTVASDPRCDAMSGRFDLRDEQGLILIVAIDSDTTIFLASGGTGSCNNLVVGTPVEVRGKEEQGKIDATEVHLQ
jgi:hypothetical protein